MPDKSVIKPMKLTDHVWYYRMPDGSVDFTVETPGGTVMFTAMVKNTFEPVRVRRVKVSAF